MGSAGRGNRRGKVLVKNMGIKLSTERKLDGYDLYGRAEFEKYYIVKNDAGVIVYESKTDPSVLIAELQNNKKYDIDELTNAKNIIQRRTTIPDYGETYEDIEIAYSFIEEILDDLIKNNRATDKEYDYEMG